MMSTPHQPPAQASPVQSSWILAHWPVIAAALAGAIAYGDMRRQQEQTTSTLVKVEASITARDTTAAARDAAYDVRMRAMEVAIAAWPADVQGMREDIAEIKQEMTAFSRSNNGQYEALREVIELLHEGAGRGAAGEVRP